MDLGRPLELFGAGDGDAEPVREKGLLLFCPRFEDISEWFVAIHPAEVKFVMGARQYQAMESWDSRDSTTIKTRTVKPFKESEQLVMSGNRKKIEDPR